MSARWRTLAAAAGVFCSSNALAQASPDRDELQYESSCTRSGASPYPHIPLEENSWRRMERESWYRSYYQGCAEECVAPHVPERLPVDMLSTEPVTSSRPESDSSDQPVPRGAALLPALNGDGRSGDSTCLCHDIIGLDGGETPLAAIPPTTSAVLVPELLELDTCDSESDDRAADASGEHAILSSEGSATMERSAVLVGTIEPLEESDGAEPNGPDAGFYDTESLDHGARFHCFYPD